MKILISIIITILVLFGLAVRQAQKDLKNIKDIDNHDLFQ
jgi:hypothetical protein